MFQLLLKMDDLESEFNLKVVLVSFKQCLNEKEEVLLEYYLDGWRGLVRCARGFPSHISPPVSHRSRADRPPSLAAQEVGVVSPTPRLRVPALFMQVPE